MLGLGESPSNERVQHLSIWWDQAHVVAAYAAVNGTANHIVFVARRGVLMRLLSGIAAQHRSAYRACFAGKRRALTVVFLSIGGVSSTVSRQSAAHRGLVDSHHST